MGLLPLRGADSRAAAAGDVKGKSAIRIPRSFPIRSRQLALLGLLSLLFLLLACAPDAKQSTFGTAGPVAEKQLLLFNVLLWVMVAVFVLVEGVPDLRHHQVPSPARPG